LALANATLYLDMLGHIVVAWTWLRQAIVASNAIETAESAEREFYAGKLQACRYFFAYELPRTGPQQALLRSLDDTCYAMTAEAF
jgi:butyryl-CoA dehydrogenase